MLLPAAAPPWFIGNNILPVPAVVLVQKMFCCDTLIAFRHRPGAARSGACLLIHLVCKVFKINIINQLAGRFTDAAAWSVCSPFSFFSFTLLTQGGGYFINSALRCPNQWACVVIGDTV